MRLGQLARKLEVESSAIVKILKENFREVNNHPNVKIEDEELEFLTKHFTPVQAQVVQETEVSHEPEISKEESTTLEAPEIKEDTPAFIESLRPKVITLEEEFNAKKKELESFKAEKPELEGLKVIGKIDLPEPKPKAPKEPKESDKSKGTRTINERSARQRNQKKGKRNDIRNPVETARKRAEFKSKKEKEEQLKKLKEQKKKHYEENVKAKVSEKSKRKKKKKFVEQQSVQTNNSNQKKPIQKSGNPIVRFWKWLNGDYDKFN